MGTVVEISISYSFYFVCRLSGVLVEYFMAYAMSEIDENWNRITVHFHITKLIFDQLIYLCLYTGDNFDNTLVAIFRITVCTT